MWYYSILLKHSISNRFKWLGKFSVNKNQCLTFWSRKNEKFSMFLRGTLPKYVTLALGKPPIWWTGNINIWTSSVVSIASCVTKTCDSTLCSFLNYFFRICLHSTNELSLTRMKFSANSIVMFELKEITFFSCYCCF